MYVAGWSRNQEIDTFEGGASLFLNYGRPYLCKVQCALQTVQPQGRNSNFDTYENNMDLKYISRLVSKAKARECNNFQKFKFF